MRHIAIVLAEPVYDDNGHILRVDPQPCFAHGQLTVALTRVGHPDRVTIYLDPGTFAHCRTPFVVYPEALLANTADGTTTVAEPGMVGFDTVFGDGLMEANDWASILWHANTQVAEGRRNAALASVLQYRAPMWGSIQAELWYEFFTGRRPADATQYYEQLAFVRMHADDVMQSTTSTAGPSIWSGGVDDSVSFDQWRDWCSGQCVTALPDHEPPPAAQGSPIDYHPDEMDAVRANEMMAQFSANVQQWTSMVDPSGATDPNAAGMDLRWEHNLLTDRNNVSAYFDDRPALLATGIDPFNGRLPVMSDDQRSVWDGIGSDMWNWAVAENSTMGGDLLSSLNGDED